MHGHSRKKCVFIYGNQFPLSSEKYYRTRIIPKFLGDETQKFRFYSSQFKYETYKKDTARIRLAQDYNLMNCYTLEASFHGYFDGDRNNFEFTEGAYEEMGEHVVNSLYEYMVLVEEEQRQKQIKQLEAKKHNKATAKKSE